MRKGNARALFVGVESSPALSASGDSAGGCSLQCPPPKDIPRYVLMEPVGYRVLIQALFVVLEMKHLKYRILDKCVTFT